ncbi:MAG: UDP-N-acetylmuramic acid hydroxylase [Ktedonobacterales bacterium]|nr:MAG: UDP-N-acetylmuramic acid hydroxylase [Ktedonobacterales bacterium]
MEITFVGHAGLYIETRHGSILCDPWFNPAYFASWFPFPSNEDVDKEKIGRPDYLFVSHIHHDHFDPAFLRDHVWKDATVLLPEFPINNLELALRDLGFTKFIYTKNGQQIEVDGLKIAILASVAPTDGPLGDSGLIVDDGEVRIYDQNDSRPVDMDTLQALGPYDAHFVQYSGAIWYPMVYQYPEPMMRTLGSRKRQNEMARAVNYIQQIGATQVIPHAGPPCFLDDDLFAFNDIDRDPTNTFPDQTVFLEYMAEHGLSNGHLMIPGSVMTLGKDRCAVRHAQPEDEVRAIFTEKRAYLNAYKARQQQVIDAEKASWPRGQVEILPALKAWFEPLLAIGDLTCVGVNGRLLMELDPEPSLVIDFQNRSVYAWEGQEWEYRFKFDPALIEWLIVNQVEDWINDLFLSCRFEATRKGAYNEYIYNFFKCLTPERLEYAEGYYAERSTEHQLFEIEGYRIQRRCPHLKADLTRFGKVEDGILTCTMHGWRFELATGRCLTSDDRKLYSVPVGAAEGEEAITAAEQPAYVPPPAVRCKHCWFMPEGTANGSGANGKGARPGKRPAEWNPPSRSSSGAKGDGERT